MTDDLKILRELEKKSWSWTYASRDGMMSYTLSKNGRKVSGAPAREEHIAIANAVGELVGRLAGARAGPAAEAISTPDAPRASKVRGRAVTRAMAVMRRGCWVLRRWEVSALAAAATTTNSIDSNNWAQIWKWGTLTTQTALSLTTSSMTGGTLLSLQNTAAAATATGDVLLISLPAVFVAAAHAARTRSWLRALRYGALAAALAGLAVAAAVLLWVGTRHCGE